MKSHYLTSLMVALLLSGCTTVDDYLYGKDNTPQAKPLEDIKPEFAVNEKWVSHIDIAKNVDPFLKIKPVVSSSELYTATSNGTVQALNKKDGSVKWSESAGATISAGPALSANRVIVATDTAKVIAFDAQNGKKAWEASVSGEVLAKPLFVKGKVILKTLDGNVYALSLQDGHKIWLAEHGSPNIILKASSSPVLLKNNVLLVGFSDGRLDAIEVDSGNVIWSKALNYAQGSSDVERLVDIDADPIIEGDNVYLAGYQGYVGALSLSNGDFIWKKPSSTYKNIKIKGNTLFMTDSQDIVYALNKRNGSVLWKQQDLVARGLTEPVIWQQQVVVGDKYGFLHMLDINTGKVVSRKQLSGSINQSPIIDNNELYVQSSNGQFLRLART